MYFTVSAYLVVQIAMMLFVALRGSVSRSESTKPRRVHLLLQKIAIVRIMRILVVMQSLHQVLRVVPLATIALRRLSRTRVQVALWIGRSISNHLSICELLDLIHSVTPTVFIYRPLPGLPISLIAGPFLWVCFVGELLLRVQEDLVQVLRVLVGLLLLTVLELSHGLRVGVFDLPGSITDGQLFSATIVSTISIAEC